MARSRTTFKPGMGSFNPGGRPKGIGAIRDIAKSYSCEAIEILVSIARDKDAKTSDRIVAVDILLDRAWGRVEHASSIANTTDYNHIQKLSTVDLQALLDDLNKSIEKFDCHPEEPKDGKK